ncbi:hypothetical protein PSTEL_18550 [Paenibacillus stellifer]|uniref:Protein kinase domain-containing protein n=1 Tax=Paenibacillus stellifer TaxID=169760 RepID=A0A089LTF1_9BACL|nr:protein kinase [Paenibacillus stellifer]AIQ64816.1 hypothetical protein PSTEL_18550 [Paenibacillus stellifer]
MFERLRAFVAAWRDYPLEPGALIGGRYEVISRLGLGSYGLTYRCLDRESKREVAVKQAKPSKKDIGYTMLLRERDVLLRLDHPRIPSCRDFIEDKGSVWLVTDYIYGSTFEQLIFDEGSVFGEKETLGFILRLMDVVGYIHEKGIAHLDLRIPNIIAKGEELYVIDFGLARPFVEASDQADQNFLRDPDPDGLPARMPASISSDLHDIGHLMLFMLYSGFSPQRGQQERSWTEELPLSPAMRGLLLRLLDHPESYQDTGELIDELRTVLTQVS